jgi:hypothetical protein
MTSSRKQVFLNLQQLRQRDNGVYHILPAAEKVPVHGVEPGPPGSCDTRMSTIYGNVIKEDGKFRMWYTGMPDAQSHEENADVMLSLYAESDDGFNWHKPDLKLTGQNRYPGNNLIQFPGAILGVVNALPGTDAKYLGVAMINCTMFEPIPDVCDDGRFDYIPGTWIMASDDGLNWRPWSNGPVVNHGDVAVLFADHVENRYYLYNKFAHYHGLYMRRAFMGLTSEDGRNWEGYRGSQERARHCFLPDDWDDLQAAQRGFLLNDYYNLALHRTGDLFVSVEQMLMLDLPLKNAHGQNPAGLASWRLGYSNDGLQWFHPKGRPAWLEGGPPGAYDAGFMVSANTFTEHNDDLLLYYGGSREFHGWCINESFEMIPDIPLEAQQNMASVCAAARIKRDRFGGLACTWIGSFTIEDEAPEGDIELFINAKCGKGTGGPNGQDGRVRVAISASCERDPGHAYRYKFDPIPGFSLDDCQPVTGDSVGAPVRYRNADVNTLPRRTPLFLQIELERSEVFATEWRVTGR